MESRCLLRSVHLPAIKGSPAAAGAAVPLSLELPLADFLNLCAHRLIRSWQGLRTPRLDPPSPAAPGLTLPFPDSDPRGTTTTSGASNTTMRGAGVGAGAGTG
ncbi:unnamed protein product, partial [Discosporangium mesarthrocarpum]